MEKRLILKTTAVSALLLGVIPAARANVTTTLTIGDDTTLAETGFAGTLPGNLSLEGNGLYGVYQFTGIP